jgi:hypothetical protein
MFVVLEQMSVQSHDGVSQNEAFLKILQSVNSPNQIKSSNAMTEHYTLLYNPIFSLPIRMPGITISVDCSTPNFQLTLRGGCDESGIFEMNQTKNIWKITPMNFALGRLVYDIVWEDGLYCDKVVCLNVLYVTVIKSNKNPNLQTIESRKWSLDINPRNWIMLPKSRYQLLKIQTKWILNEQQSVQKCVKPESKEEHFRYTIEQQSVSDNFLCVEEHNPEYRLAIATIPLKIIDKISTNGILDLSDIDILPFTDHKLNFSQIFGAWLVFEEAIDWNKYTLQLTYFLD